MIELHTCAFCDRPGFRIDPFSGQPCCDECFNILVGCRCGRIKVGSTITESRNWNPDCPEHGLGSEWYRSPEQVEKRRVQSERLRELQRQAAAARRLARETP